MKKRIPVIRFRGYDDEWSSTSLKDISYKSIDKNHQREYNVVFTNSAELGIIDQRDYFDRNVANENSLSNYYIVDPNDYVYNPRISTTAPVGPINRNKLTYTGVMSPLYYVFRVKSGEIDYNFLDYFFKSTAWHSFMYKNGNSGARSDRFSISDNMFVQLPIAAPKSKDEQKRIGDLLTTLDTLIRKLEQKLEKLRNIKQALLNQMFINVNRGGYTAPLIRFKEFKEEWEVETLANITERVVRKNSNNESSLPLTISAQYGLIDQNEFFNSRIASKDVSGYYLIENGEFAYNKSTSDGYPYGAVKRLDKYEKGVLSTLYIVFALNGKKLDSNFLTAFFETRNWYDHISQRAAEGARNHGLLNISSDDFFDLMLYKPKTQNEQQKVSSSVIAIEGLVASTSSKLTKMRTMKQSLLQKMFA